MPRAATSIAVAGSAAIATLGAHHRGRVLAVFQRSFYVRFDDDLVCFGPIALRPGPLNALYPDADRVPWPARGLAPDVPVLREGATLRIGRFRFDLRAAEVWTRPAAPPLAVATLRAGLRRLASSAARRAPGGFGPLLCAPGGCARAPDSALLATAAPTLAALRAWLATRLAGGDGPPPAVDALIGLGGGLTPSGDDYLCGVMTALNYFGNDDLASQLASVVLPRAAQETNLVSKAYLRCAAAGEASVVLFDVLECLLGADRPWLEQRLDAVNAVGHTSGWDCLAGAAAVCAVLADAR